MFQEGSMNRRGFLLTAASTMAVSASAKDLSPTDLRPPNPIGLAKPNREVALESVAKCRVADPEAVKLLQLTDLHYYCNRDLHGPAADEKTRDDVRRLVDRHEPDLIAFSGDVWHDPGEGMSEEIFAYALAAMTGTGRPWLFIWGNHDLLDDYANAQARLTEAPNSLYRGAYTGGNYRVLLEDGTGTPLADLICLNTTTQGVQEPQERWLRGQEPTGRAAFCFLHIPLAQYIEVWGSGRARGVKHEAVCTYGEDGSALPLLRRLDVRACFCGHDHVNDYTGKMDGVDLVYGRATGHAGYGGDQLAKGGKLITVNAVKGTCVWKTVFADGSTWEP